MRQFVSALLLAAVGFCIGGMTGGLLTFYVYFIGGWLGAPLGCAYGAWYGWRTPLRDATIVFVCYSAIFAAATYVTNGKTGSDQFLAVLLSGLIAGPGGLLLPRLPVLFLSVAHRRVLAIVLAAAWVLCIAIRVYLWLWVWE